MKPKKFVPPEFSRIVDADKLNVTHALVASEVECAAVAKRLELLGLESLTAKLTLKRIRSDQLLQVKGSYQAKLTQACVVTLEPVEAVIDEPLEALFSDGPIPTLSNDFDIQDEGDVDAPEPIIAGKIDLGELVVQHLSLALDPYPRKPGAEFTGYEA